MSAFNAQEQAAVTETAECVVIGDATLYRADCIALMRTLPDSSVDSIVTDPPYGIAFMGKAWDGADIVARTERRRGFTSHAPDAGPNGSHKSIAAEAGKYDLTPAAMRAFQDFSEEWAREAFRVIKPGGHLLSFSSARTYHRMTCGIEDAGFEVRDQALWLYGSGFPKSHNLTGEHEGWGTALKPAHEPICVARKPLAKGHTVASNMLAFGTGAINIDGCRVEPTGESRPRVGETTQDQRYTDAGGTNFAATPGVRGGAPEGRWPANLIHDGSDEVMALFPAQAGASAPVRGIEASAASVGRVTGARDRVAGIFHGGTGSAARFFYCAKASRADRNAGLVDPGPQFEHGATLRKIENAPKTGNIHPTVKPTDLIAYLQRLVTPPGGTTLDLFMGSGTGAKAAVREGFKFIGFEISAEYFPIAVARTQHEVDVVAAAVIADAAAAKELARQADLFAEREV